MKRAISLLAAFAFGALLVYAIMSPQHPEEWGVVVVRSGGLGGPSLWGLFESKQECFQARTSLIEEYRQAAGGEAGAASAVREGSRTLVLRRGPPITTAEDLLRRGSTRVTFSCLPLSEIRGLSLSEGQAPKSN